MRRLLSALCAAVAVIAVGAPTASGADGFGSAGAAATLCRNTYGGDVIFAYRVGCSKARQVVRAWGRGVKRDRRVTRTALGYRCRGRTDSVEGLSMRCRRGEASVRFYANVP